MKVYLNAYRNGTVVGRLDPVNAARSASDDAYLVGYEVEIPDPPKHKPSTVEPGQVWQLNIAISLRVVAVDGPYAWLRHRSAAAQAGVIQPVEDILTWEYLDMEDEA